MDRRYRALSLSHYLWFFLLVLGPFLALLVSSFAQRTALGELKLGFSLQAYKELLDPIYLDLFFRTIWISFSTTTICLVLAFPCSLYLSRLSESRARLVLCLVLIPLWTNFLVRTFSVMDILRLKPFGLDWIYTPQGVIFGLVYCYLPFSILPIYNALKKIDPYVIEAAEDLGASPWKIFTKILWPLSKKGVSTSAIVIFIPCFGEFLVPELVGGGRLVLLGSFLQNQFLAARNWPLGSAAIVLLLVVTLLFMRLMGRIPSSSENVQ